MKKVYQADLQKYRKYAFDKQKGLCGLCKLPMHIAECATDHDHNTGHIRKILHLGCNAFEGKVKYAFSRYIGKASGLQLSQIVVNLGKYLLDDYSNNPLHPSELDPLEKELKEITKKLKKLKSESHIEKYKARAKELRQEIKKNKELNKWKEE